MQETPTINAPVTLPLPQAAHDLTIVEARELLDWLEAHHLAPVEIFLQEDGLVTVRWQA
jgi:hypothetical protein